MIKAPASWYLLKYIHLNPLSSTCYFTHWWHSHKENSVLKQNWSCTVKRSVTSELQILGTTKTLNVEWPCTWLESKFIKDKPYDNLTKISSSPDFHEQFFCRLFYLREALLNSHLRSVYNSGDSSSSIVTKHKFCLVIVTSKMDQLNFMLYSPSGDVFFVWWKMIQIPGIKVNT